MGRRSINTTKSGKYMNPTDQARKEARKKELKKNKKQRMMVRQAVLKGKDPLKILQEMEIIDQMEFNTTEAPKLNEKVLKDKRRKLKETFTRVMKLYEKENPDFARDLRKQEYEYDKKRMELQVHYEQVKNAERVQLDQIPLPDAPQNAANIPLPNEIPLPLLGEPVMPHSILKRSSVFGERETTLVELEIARRRPPPGPPPEAPPELSDSEDEEYDPAKGIEENIGAVSMDTDHVRPKSSDRENNQSHKSRKIRWDDDETRDPGEEEKDTRLKFGSRARGKGVTPLQAKMLKLAGQDAPREDKGSGKSRSRSSSDSSDSDSDHERSHDRRRERDRRGRDRDREHRKDRNKDEKEKAVDSEMMPDVAPPGEEGTEEDTEVGTRLVPPGPPPGAPPSLPPGAPPGPPPGAPMMMFRPPPLGAAPPGPPPRLLPPGPPPGRPSGLPPGPPPGLPPNIRMPPRMPHAPPSVPPPRVLRPPGTAPALAPPGVPLPPGVSAPNPNVLSAPPSITKKPQGPGGEDKNRATIEAKPQIKHLIGDVTRFTPTALKVKREAKGMKGSTKTTAKEDERRSHQQMAAPANPHGKTKDDAYDQFMREMQGLF